MYCVYHHQTCPLWRRHWSMLLLLCCFFTWKQLLDLYVNLFITRVTVEFPPPPPPLPPPTDPAATQRTNFCPSTGFLVVATSIDVVRLIPLRYRFDGVLLIPVLPSLFVFALLKTFFSLFFFSFVVCVGIGSLRKRRNEIFFRRGTHRKRMLIILTDTSVFHRFLFVF